MTRNLLFLFSLLCTTIQAQEQNFRTADARVTTEELLADVYPKDSTANAFYIFEEGYTRFEADRSLKLLTDYTAKIKILNQDGYDQANIDIRLFKNGRSSEKIEEIEAVTYYMEDGFQKSEKLDPSQIYTEDTPDYDLVKFTFPAVRPGAVLVYSYKKESPFMFNFETWWFQEEIPKLYSRFVSEIPGNFNYNIKKVGTLELDSHDTSIVKNCVFKNASNPGSCARAEYVMKDIPAFVEEDYLTSKYNYISRIDFELIEVTSLQGITTKYTRTWKDVDRELRTDKDLGRQLRKTSLVKKILPDDIQIQPNNLEKAKAIFAFVKDNYKWNGEYKIFDDMKIKELLKDKTGNVSAINTLLHNIYKEQGFEVLPVLNSTRANGLPTKLYPVLSEFNYLTVQLQVDEKTYLLDATEKNADFGLLPFRCLNMYARLLDFDNGSSWIDIDPVIFSTIAYRDSLTINADGTSTGKSEQLFSGYHALLARNKMDKLEDSEIFGAMTSASTHTRSLKTSYINKDDLAENFQLEFALHNETQKINDLIYVNPFSFQFFSKNPFQLPERTYPIDFGFRDAYSYSVNLRIPEGYEVTELPEQQLVRLPENAGTLQFIIQQPDEGNINVHCRVTFPQAIYDAAFYPYLKDFFNRMVDIQQQSLIVLRQKA